MNRFAIIAPFLLIPPVAVGVTVLARDPGRIDVASILDSIEMSVLIRMADETTSIVAVPYLGRQSLLE